MKLETTGKAFKEHWAWAATKGLMNPTTAKNLKAACTKVLDVLDDGDTLDVLELDVEDAIARFINLRAKQYTPASLETYASRFRKSVGLFKDYAKNPSGWKVQSRVLKVKRDKAPPVEKKSQKEDPPTEKEIIERDLDSQLIDYPFPLRRGLTARLALPSDLTAKEVKRINAFLMTLTNEFLDDE